MKLTDYFNTFLIDEVNLNKSRIKTLKDRVNTIGNFIRASDWKPNVIRITAQGSWAHKTIIKPSGSRGFDADILVFIDPVGGWTAKDYVLELRRIFNGSDVYKDKLSLNTRCIVLDYSGDFHLDIVPCVVDRPGGNGKYEVCNRVENNFEATDSEAYTAWLEKRNDWVGNDRLREVTRLFKYLRDIKTTFSCKSVLLTTLLGERITQADEVFRTTYFPDLSTSLKTLIGRLDNYLHARPKLHNVCNPVLSTENFIRHWDDEKYANFRNMLHKYRGWIDEAYEEPDEAQSIAKWQRVFGDEFARGAKVELAEAALNLVPVPVNRSRFQDAVDAVKTAGREVLAQVRTSLPWIKPVPWRMASASNRISVTISATLHTSRNGQPISTVLSGFPLPKKSEILFKALFSTGIPIGSSKDFNVQWRVVNTDHDAYAAKALRGGFYPSDRSGCRWESTQYRGIHWVEAFVIRKRDRLCVGQSERFFVVIE
ncbi:MAG: nucleotidyltransferase [Syntrophobacteraceae bacterium]